MRFDQLKSGIDFAVSGDACRAGEAAIYRKTAQGTVERVKIDKDGQEVRGPARDLSPGTEVIIINLREPAERAVEGQGAFDLSSGINTERANDRPPGHA